MAKLRFFVREATICIAVLLLLSSCEQRKKVKEQAENAKNEISQNFAEGNEYEIIVVGQGLEQDSMTRFMIEQIFGVEVTVLPQYEGLFNIVYTNYNRFDEKMKKNASLLFIHIASGNDSTAMTLKKLFKDIPLADQHSPKFIHTSYDNKWVYPQKVLVISASDNTQLLEGLEKYGTSFRNDFDKTEKIRIMRRLYAKGRNNTQTNQLYKNFHIALSVPKGFVNILERRNEDDTLLKKTGLSSLIWYRWTTEYANNNFIIYTMPYSKKALPSPEELLKIKNRLTKKLVHGQNPGSYMVTTSKVYAPQIKELRMANMKAIEIKGLWETEGDWMGGPYIFYALNDQERQRLVFIDAFVYAAGAPKKPFIKRLEVIFETFRPIEE